MDSATRSYTAWVREIACGEIPTYSMDLDAATRSYIAWAKWVEGWGSLPLAPGYPKWDENPRSFGQ